MGITTKSGDDGYTDVFGGNRLQKDHPIIECMGTFDELNAFLGDAKASLSGSPSDGRTAKIISEIQKDLFLFMGVLAGMPIPAGGMGEDRLNSLIAELESKLPSFTSFVVPGTNPVSAKLHIARAVSRRAERRLIGIGLDEKTKAAVTPYINRLSDLLFLLAEQES